MTHSQRVRRVSDGVVASYLHDIARDRRRRPSTTRSIRSRELVEGVRVGGAELDRARVVGLGGVVVQRRVAGSRAREVPA
jgi:hypothetical protein